MDTQKRLILWISAILVVGIIAIGTYEVATAKPAQLPATNGSLSMPLDATDHTKGASKPEATVVEYSDFECPACAAYQPMVEAVYAQYKDRISFTYRHFPLPQHLNAPIAAYAAEAASNQGKFWEMGDMLFNGQNDWAQLDTASAQAVFATYAQKLGLDMAKFKTDENSAAVKSRVERDLQSGTASAIDHTPTFFINGKMVNNPQSEAEFKALIDYAITHP